ncbi:MAG: nucleotidyl transferase AbiEii/AbiGii toxin family protein [bacterium]
MTDPALASSVLARLKNHARNASTDFNLTLTRFALERILYRIGVSDHAANFLLKGAMLFDLWFDLPHRPTRDLDLLGFGSSDLSVVERIFRDICSIDGEDGIVFNPETIQAREIRKPSSYSGVQITMVGMIGRARCPIQIDIGFGDVVKPSASLVQYPVILDTFPPPRLRAYPVYTVVAEKFEAISSLGITNSRMKDFFDLWVISQRTDLDGELLRQALLATFGRRETALKSLPPVGLTKAFADEKQPQWDAFLKRNDLSALDLESVISKIWDFLMPVVVAAHGDEVLHASWTKGGTHWRNKT